MRFGLEGRHRACAPFACVHFTKNQRPSGVSLESFGLENIPQVSANRAKDVLNHDALKAVSATLLVLKWSGAIFRPRSWKPSVRSFYLCLFHWKLRPSGVSLATLRVGNIPQDPANWAKVAPNLGARKALWATLSVFKLSGAIFRPRSSTPSVRLFYLCAFHWKLRLSGASLESARLENIPQLRLNCAKVAQNHDARKAVSATLSVLKRGEAIFWPRSPTPSVRSFYLCPFHWKLMPSGDNLESPEVENIPQVPSNRAKFSQNHYWLKAASGTLSV